MLQLAEDVEMDMCFGDRFSTERQRLNYTQKSFAAAMGIAPCTQALLEDDHWLPTIDYLARAAQLGVDVDFVLLGQRAHKFSSKHSHQSGVAPLVSTMNSVPKGQKTTRWDWLKPWVKSLTFGS